MESGCKHHLVLCATKMSRSASTALLALPGPPSTRLFSSIQSAEKA